MGKRISGKNTKSMTWEKIAASFKSSTANDPWNLWTPSSWP
jgi:hypothetical protein